MENRTQEREAHEEVNAVVTRESFDKKYPFKKHPPWTASVMRQWFTENKSGDVVSGGSQFLEELGKVCPLDALRDTWGLGLTESQLNHATPFVSPLDRRRFLEQMEAGDDIARIILSRLRLRFRQDELAPNEIRDFRPTKAYTRLLRRYDRKILEHSIRVCTTSIRVSVPDHAAAIRASNILRDHVERIAIATSFQKRRYWNELSTMTGKRPVPDHYKDWNDFYLAACDHGWASDPYAAPHVLSISPDGVIRMDCYGMPRSPDQARAWTMDLFELLAPVMKSED